MQYTGVVDAVKRILRDEGWHGFYKGMNVKLLQTVIAAALLMMLKEEIFSATRLMLQPTVVVKPVGLPAQLQPRLPALPAAAVVAISVRASSR